VNPVIPLKNIVIVFVIGLVCLGFSSAMLAVTPAPDGGYPGFNTAEGTNALFSRTTGVQNTALGAGSLFSDTTGSTNTAVGTSALRSNTTEGQNTAVGAFALSSNTASQNVAVGFQALKSNVNGFENTAVGYQALFKNFGTTLFGRNQGNYNTATGYQALFSNRSGKDNTAIGASALFSNVEGGENTAVGYQALADNTGGGGDTATGWQALQSNTTGSENTATGIQALLNNTRGFENTANGFLALGGNIIGNFNIALGANAGTDTTGSNNIDIGNIGVAGEANTIRIGNTVATLYNDGITHPAQTHTFIAGIRGRTTANANAIPVVIDSAGQLGTTSSSGRFKKEIKPMDKASEAILALKPVTFHYKSDSAGTPQFGLIAEEVAAVNPDLVVRDENGEIYTVRYDAVNAMLLNEFLKEHKAFVQEQRKVQELEASNAQQQRNFAEQQKQIEALTAGLQKVSTQLELNRPAPQTVLNNQ
jgi:endosialidase-like protein